MAKKPNWTKIQAEYVTGSASYKDLAKKHKVSLKTLTDHGKAGHWVDLRKQNRSKTAAKAVEAIGNRQAADLARINTIADGLLDKIEEAVNQLGTSIVRHHYEEPTEEGSHTYEYDSLGEKGEAIDTRAVKQLTDAIRGLKEIKGLQSDLQKQEQEARIALLRRQAEKGDDSRQDINVTMEEVDDLAN